LTKSEADLAHTEKDTLGSYITSETSGWKFWEDMGNLSIRPPAWLGKEAVDNMQKF